MPEGKLGASSLHYPCGMGPCPHSAERKPNPGMSLSHDLLGSLERLVTEFWGHSYLG